MADMSNQISNWAGGGATVTLGAVQALIGMRNQKKNKRPSYEIPDEIKQNLSQAQQAALQGLPEEQKQQFLSNLQRGTAYGMNQLGSRKAGLSGLATLNEQQNEGYQNLLASDSQARMANQQQLYGMRQNMADYKDQAFQINRLNPYYEKTAQNNAMIGAGMQNMSQGFQSSNSGYDWGSANKQTAPQLQSAPQAPQYQTYQMSPYQTQGMPTTSQAPSDTGQKIDVNNGGYTSGTPKWW